MASGRRRPGKTRTRAAGQPPPISLQARSATEPERRDRFYERRPLRRQREDGSQGARPRRPADGIRASACADSSWDRPQSGI